MRVARARLTAGALLLALACGLGASAAMAQSVATPMPPRALVSRDDHALALHLAHQQTGVPIAWLAAVIQVESAGDARAVSSTGAMGLMQLMPGTWSDLRARLKLGADPFDVRDNVLAGATYLRELFDRYGADGFLAAYNAGPGRWEEHLRVGRPLPPETRAYVARLAPRLGLVVSADPVPGDWRAAPLSPGEGRPQPLTRRRGLHAPDVGGLFPIGLEAQSLNPPTDSREPTPP